MMKALYSGVSGMRSHQTKMDVIGNNIANVNTNGYKTQRATFRDVYYQTMSNPSQAATGIGGTNSSQVGYGAQIASVDTIHTLSGYSPTNKETDLYINGEGYLKVIDASGEMYYTRYGALNFDSEGQLVDSNGSIVLGLNSVIDASGTVTTAVVPKTAEGTDGKGIQDTLVGIKIPINDYSNITINSDGTITGVKTGTDTIETLGLIAIATVPNQAALKLEGSSYYVAGNNTGTITYHAAGLGGSGALVTGGLEMSNVDLANEFSDMIITQRGFQANTKIISVVDQMLEELVNLKR
ncbi:MAG: flagellar hook-basal body complex protein [Sedimentibacter sp.]|uniref:flagellar hook-basal body complex protein n=1 Tax=Sedimentibacter sp. TaxID=1960295 RepID=UPI0029823FEF|nr:flagellar hook-basal body complex protein [Sedimentibacter sp.]MDW5298743.1 flagellar hook-basal body complex protein [Sedimentibacter sp.]